MSPMFGRRAALEQRPPYYLLSICRQTSPPSCLTDSISTVFTVIRAAYFVAQHSCAAVATKHRLYHSYVVPLAMSGRRAQGLLLDQHASRAHEAMAASSRRSVSGQRDLADLYETPLTRPILESKAVREDVLKNIKLGGVGRSRPDGAASTSPPMPRLGTVPSLWSRRLAASIRRCGIAALVATKNRY